MRIDLASNGLQQTENAGSQKTGGRGAGAAGVRDPGDSARFSFDESRIGGLVSQALSAPEIRQTTVSSLAHALHTGAYSLDPSQVAGALVAAYRGEPAG